MLESAAEDSNYGYMQDNCLVINPWVQSPANTHICTHKNIRYALLQHHIEMTQGKARSLRLPACYALVWLRGPIPGVLMWSWHLGCLPVVILGTRTTLWGMCKLHKMGCKHHNEKDVWVSHSGSRIPEKQHGHTSGLPCDTNTVICAPPPKV